jgi:hypothetical protein
MLRLKQFRTRGKGARQEPAQLLDAHGRVSPFIIWPPG